MKTTKRFDITEEKINELEDKVIETAQYEKGKKWAEHQGTVIQLQKDKYMCSKSPRMGRVDRKYIWRSSYPKFSRFDENSKPHKVIEYMGILEVQGTQRRSTKKTIQNHIIFQLLITRTL